MKIPINNFNSTLRPFTTFPPKWLPSCRQNEPHKLIVLFFLSSLRSPIMSSATNLSRLSSSSSVTKRKREDDELKAGNQPPPSRIPRISTKRPSAVVGRPPASELRTPLAPKSTNLDVSIDSKCNTSVSQTPQQPKAVRPIAQTTASSIRAKQINRNDKKITALKLPVPQQSAIAKGPR